jgi:hypothetical protein
LAYTLSIAAVERGDSMSKKKKPIVVAAMTGLFAVGLLAISFTADARIQEASDYTALCSSINATNMQSCKTLFADCTMGDQGRLAVCTDQLTAGGLWCDQAAARYQKGGAW